MIFLDCYPLILELIRWPHSEGCKDPPLETGNSSGQLFLLIPSKYSYSCSCLEESPAVLPCVWDFDSGNSPARIPLIVHCAKREGPWGGGGGGRCQDRCASKLKDENDLSLS